MGMITGTLKRLSATVRGHSRLAAAAAAGVLAAVATIVARRRTKEQVDLPDPASVAADTAVSVHNAAKLTVISAVRENDEPDDQVIAVTVREAMLDATRSGADVTAVAMGAVLGAAEVAHVLDLRPREAAAVASRAAVDAASAQGEVAGGRVLELLAPFVGPEPDAGSS